MTCDTVLLDAILRHATARRALRAPPAREMRRVSESLCSLVVEQPVSESRCPRSNFGRLRDGQDSRREINPIWVPRTTINRQPTTRRACLIPKQHHGSRSRSRSRKRKRSRSRSRKRKCKRKRTRKRTRQRKRDKTAEDAGSSEAFMELQERKRKGRRAEFGGPPRGCSPWPAPLPGLTGCCRCERLLARCSTPLSWSLSLSPLELCSSLGLIASSSFSARQSCCSQYTALAQATNTVSLGCACTCTRTYQAQ